MRSPVIVIGPAATLREAARVLRHANVGTLAVTESREIEGILSERDVVGAVAEALDADHCRVSEVMTRNPRYLTPYDRTTTALEIMHAAGLRHLPVMEDGELVGIVSIRDLAAPS